MHLDPIVVFLRTLPNVDHIIQIIQWIVCDRAMISKSSVGARNHHFVEIVAFNPTDETAVVGMLISENIKGESHKYKY